MKFQNQAIQIKQERGTTVQRKGSAGNLGPIARSTISIFTLNIHQIIVIVSACCLIVSTGSPWVLADEETVFEVPQSLTYAFDNASPCSPCGETLNGCGKKSGWEFDFGGWAETGIYTNSHGFVSNGQMHTKGNERTDFHLDQLYLHGDVKYRTRNGVEFGGRADLVYGVDAKGMQSWRDDSFDSDWGLNRHGYAMSAYQLFGTVSYEKLRVKVGKFITPIGWEAAASKNNFFYSHSYCYWLEPATHCGVLADYTLNDRLKISAGWTAGSENSFKNRFDDSALLAGFTYRMTKKATIYYWMTLGKTENGQYQGDWRFGSANDDLARRDYFVQSLCFEWMLSDRFTYVMQYNLRNDADVEAGTFRTRDRYSAYGINNHFLYQINKKWAAGLRLEWLRDNGDFGYVSSDGNANYFQTTIGLNWTPNKYITLRPEIRYDTVLDGTARPYGDNRSDQFSGGVALLFLF